MEDEEVLELMEKLEISEELALKFLLEKAQRTEDHLEFHHEQEKKVIPQNIADRFDQAKSVRYDPDRVGRIVVCGNCGVVRTGSGGERS